MKQIYPIRWLAATAVIGVTAMLPATLSAQRYTFDTRGASAGLAVTRGDARGAQLTYTIAAFDLEPAGAKGEGISSIALPEILIPNDEGLPDLPCVSRFVAIPRGARAVATVKRSRQERIAGVDIAPALRIESENETPTANYVKNSQVYNTNALYPAQTVAVSEPMSLRGVDVVAVSLTPFQYNPVTRELVVTHDLEVEVAFEGGDGSFGDDRLRSPWFDPILRNALCNADMLPKVDYSARQRDGEGCEYLIVVPNSPEWRPWADTLAQYRREQGIDTRVMSLEEMGVTSNTQLKTFMHNAYNTWATPPVAVLLMADHGTNLDTQIPAETISHPTEGSCITDNQYADPTGDRLPDMVFARMAAENTSQLAVMVSKVIEYEYGAPCMEPDYYQNPITALGWQTERWFQLCSETVGGYLRSLGKTPVRINAIYDGTPGSVWSSAQNTSSVVAYFGPQGQDYLPATPGELGGWTGGTPAQVVTAINNGAFILQHRDHGFENGWGEPAFTSSYIPQLNNVGKMSFVFSINCLTGKFNNSSPCFAEVFHRHTSGGQNAGAVGVLCPTEVSFSFVNDVFVWGAYDLFDPGFMPSFGPFAGNSGNWMPAFGNVAGKYFLAQSSWPYNTNSKEITLQMFTTHTDAFLRLYSEVPQELSISHMPTQFAGMPVFSFTAEEGAWVALSVDGELLAAAQATGAPQELAIEPQNPPTRIKVVATMQNRLRYVQEIEVIPAQGAYVAVSAYAVPQLGQGADYGQEADIEVEFRNYGIDMAGGCLASIASESPWAEVVAGEHQLGAVDAGQTLAAQTAFRVAVADSVPDRTPLPFLVTVADDQGNEWTSRLRLTANAPKLAVSGITFAEKAGNGNGRMDMGEIWTADVTLANKGHAAAADAQVTMATAPGHVTLIDAQAQIDAVPADSSAAARFDIIIDPDVPMGTRVTFDAQAAAGKYAAEGMATNRAIGLVLEDFESGDLESFDWRPAATYGWTLVEEGAYDGDWSLKSATISHNQTSSIALGYDVQDNDSISFYVKVSSENNYDKLKFFINNQQRGEWSGNVAWGRQAYAVTPADSLFRWDYTKDGSVSSGTDCAWIDHLVLPADPLSGAANNAPFFATAPDSVYRVYNDEFIYTFAYGDADGDELTVEAVELPAWMELGAIDASTSFVAGRHSEADSSAIERVVLRLSDGLTAVAQFFRVNTFDPAGVPAAWPAPEATLTVYPNPASGDIHIRLQADGAPRVAASLHTLDGRLARAARLEPQAGGAFRASVEGLPAGIYLLRVEIDGYTYTQKITVAGR